MDGSSPVQRMASLRVSLCAPHTPQSPPWHSEKMQRALQLVCLLFSSCRARLFFLRPNARDVGFLLQRLALSALRAVSNDLDLPVCECPAQVKSDTMWLLRLRSRSILYLSAGSQFHNSLCGVKRSAANRDPSGEHALNERRADLWRRTC
jgi:hypothetical protein